jgi:signal peptidase I
MRAVARALLWIVGTLAVLIGLARVVAIRWWQIPSDDVYLSASLAPTLQGGDTILLWRLTKPDLGDLVMCPEPKHPERVVIGRIAAEGGQTIRVEGTRVTVEGKTMPVESSCIEDSFVTNDPQTGISQEQRCQLEVMGGRTHPRGSASGPTAPLPVEATVPEDMVYLVSDNRQFPYDSRDYGPVDRALCTETVVFRLVGAKGFGDSATRFSATR